MSEFSHPVFAKPPIVEAVIDIQFEQELEIDEIRKLADRLIELYPLRSEEIETNISPTIEAGLSISQRPVRIRVTAEDVADQLLLGLRSFTSSRLSPYSGWNSFLQRTQRDWKAWKQAFGPQKVARVACRYINRLDIPHSSFSPSDYVTFLPSVPNSIVSQVERYACQVAFPIEKSELKAIINSGSVDSPLVGHGGILVDIDVFLDTNVPQSDERVWGLVESIREAKNRLFMAAVTDTARELFR